MARPARPMFPLGDECADGALSLDGAAKFLAVSVREVERAIQRGELEVVHWGRKVRVLKSQCRALLAQQLAEARAAAVRT